MCTEKLSVVRNSIQVMFVQILETSTKIVLVRWFTEK